MTLEQHLVTCKVIVLTVVLIGQAQAQPLPGLQQTSPLQLDPQAQQRQSQQRQLDARHPGTPTLIAPTEGAILQIPDNQPARVLFRWQAGPGTPVDRYKLCLFEAAKSCDQSGSEVYTVSGNAQQFDAFQGLPRAKFIGKSLKWSLASCRDVLILSSPGTPQPTTKEICVASVTRQLYWTLASPKPGAFIRDGDAQPGVPTYTFHWSAVSGARAYLFCLFEGSVDSCMDRTTFPTSNPLIVDKGGASYTIDYDMPQFRGKTVRWAVAACTHWRLDQTPSSPLPDNLRCTWQRQPEIVRTVQIANPVVAPTYAFKEIKGLRYSPDNPQPIEMRWTLNRPQDVRSVKLCVVTAQGPGGSAVAPEDRSRTLGDTSSWVCDQRNVIVNPIRSPTLTSCRFRRPLLRTGSSSITVFGFAVAACNERNECAWTNPLAVIQDDAQPFGNQAICEP